MAHRNCSFMTKPVTPDTSAPSPGFRTEREMSDSAQEWLAALGLMVKQEFYTPWGICDFVGVSFDGARVKERLNLGQRRPIGPPIRIHILSHIPDSSTQRSISIARLETRFSRLLTPPELRIELERLEVGKFIRRPGKERVQKLNGWAPLHKRIVALELKISRVEEALNQARAHLCFADESYVGFPIDRAERLASSKRMSRFEETGVGIVGIARRECLVVLPSRPVPRHKDALMQMHCSERFWRTMLKDNSP